ncbi:folylpolyglutamate synthase/dihydrofolate synthase family protein [Proteinivorax hydrogeniformans]|uniref:tetrahydrofolate synthase n=1 Tax=Proteinivorax hydrogeniformans TaxID=1826727 RepID=A0AAU8HWI6_9FIRM
MKKLCSLLGNPEQKVNAIHVAGTNGKGSVTAILSSVLKEQGYKVGAYTSPALTTFGERIQINGIFANDNELDKYYDKITHAINALKGDPLGEPTEFEVVTALAFLYFVDNKVDIVVLEVGLGGRFDATNVIEKPLASVITSISKDHTAILGNTLQEIAAEKAGIIKKDSPIVLGKLKEDAYLTILDIAKSVGAPVFLEGDADITFHNYEGKNQVVSVNNTLLKLSLLGNHQLENLKTALKVLDAIKKQGYEIEDKVIFKSLSKVRLTGRFEILKQKEKEIVFDVAHNEASYSAFLDNLNVIYPTKKILIILGMYADKDTDKVAKLLSKTGYEIMTTTPDNERALGAKSLSDLLRKEGVKVIKTIENPKQAVLAALELNYDIICVTGSFSTVGPAKLAVQG